ncbi:ATP-binding protein [Brachyspira hampsonii]|uniref:ATP-binding protein n=3 Tax=Brachyspira hampsonii TaxID=1287055 RepID=A0A2U4EXP3_9SPIR|nr:ATP-binding protein [Brachyspira hampsonii]EKV58046.1 ATP-binding protein [Brachyspira hampsonii 30446]MBW5389562.1 ATP-binding protein [Brachyspira hampsonii]OEJ16740.1 ATP-binding protein [Brachyspira hampsonii]
MSKTKISSKKVSSKNNIENIKISNFTVFKNAEINFSKGLNVFIGKNGTGKTHLLKLINCLDKKLYKSNEKLELKKFNNFKNKSKEKIDDIKKSDRKFFNDIDKNSYPFDIDINKVFSRFGDFDKIKKAFSDFISYLEKKDKNKKDKKTSIETYKNILSRPQECNIAFNKNISLELIHRGFNITNDLIPIFDFILSYQKSYSFKNKNFTFIPCKDILTSSNGFAALYDKRDINFEAVYYNIIKKTELPKLRELDDDLLEIAKKIENAIGGKTIYKNNNFFIDYENIGEVSFDMAAEGHKKLALIYILIMNGEIDKNTILLLDEPESNLNPSLTDLLVNILLSLSKLGLQIFIATHNSFILDDIELQRTDKDSVMYHSFYFDENDFNSGVKIESKEILLDLENNPINEKIIKQHNEYIEDMIK